MTARKDDIYWRKAQLAARIIVRRRAGRLSERDCRLGAWLKRDSGVTNRLIDQALAAHNATRQVDHVRS